MNKAFLCILFFMLFSVSAHADFASEYKEGIRLMSSRNYSDAAASFGRALKECDVAEECQDEKTNIKINLGICLTKIGQYTESLSMLEEASKVKPKDLRLIDLLAYVSTKVGAYDKALFYYSQKLEIKPNDANALISRANIYKLELDYFKAKIDIDNALQIDPKNEDALKTMVSIYGDSNSPFFDLEKSLTYSQQLYKNDPTLRNKLIFLLQLTTIPEKRSDLLDELASLENGEELKYALEHDYLYLGIIFLRLGDIPKAVSYYEKSLPSSAHFLIRNEEIKQYASHPKIKELIKQVEGVLKK